MSQQRGFLTTHVGSLPRPEELKQLMFAREDGLPFDASALESRYGWPLRQRSNASDGPVSTSSTTARCPSPATPLMSRIGSTGFGGSGNSYVFQDLEAYPGTKTRMFDDPGRKHRKTPACNAPISMRDLESPKQDAQRLRESLQGDSPAGLFLNAASPGVTTLFFRNDFYPSPRAIPIRLRRCAAPRVRGGRRRRNDAADRLP